MVRIKTVELVNIAVLEEPHSKGIGKLLVMDVSQTPKSKGYKTIEIVLRQNPHFSISIPEWL